MKRVDGSTVELAFNPRFYSRVCITKAIEDFRDACSCESKDGKESIAVTLKAKEGFDPEELGHEFCNYVLGLMKNRGEV